MPFMVEGKEFSQDDLSHIVGDGVAQAIGGEALQFLLDVSGIQVRPVVEVVDGRLSPKKR